MKDIYKDYLFAKHYFVNEAGTPASEAAKAQNDGIQAETLSGSAESEAARNALSIVLSLANLFSIRINKGAELAQP